MTQFVEQLRNQAKWYAQPGHNARDLMDGRLLEKAADEIERLRAKIEAMERQEPAMWANSSNIVSARINQERGTVGDQHTCAETKTAYHDAPLYALPGAQNVPSVSDDIIRSSTRLLKRASGHLRWLKKDTYQWQCLNPKTRRAAELLHRDIDAMLAAQEAKP